MTERLAFVAALLCAAAALAEECPAPGADLVTGDIAAAGSWGIEGGVAAFSIGVQNCNVGSTPIAWQFNTNQHPVFGQNLFRLRTVDGATRFEQIGQGWVFHEYFALSSQFCCQNCQPTNGSTLGVGCSSATSASIAGNRPRLGPKWQISAATGGFTQPPDDPEYSGVAARRLQAHVSDIDPAQDGAGALFFFEAQCVTPDDAPGANDNNASWRQCSILYNGATANVALSGATRREQSAIHAWREHDPAVLERDLQIAGDGLVILAARATRLASGLWRYEYALQNLTSDRAIQAFAIPLPPDAGVENVGFHDVDYHSGDGPGGVDFSGQDWDAAVGAGQLAWSSETYAENESANALRWGTLYNFRFDSDAAPGAALATLALFKPSDPPTVSALAIGPSDCPTDLDADGDTDLTDLSRLLASFGKPADANATEGDVDHDGDVDLTDLSSLLAVFGGSCS